MTRHAAPDFRGRYRELPEAVRESADKAFALLKQNPRHPSLHLKKVGRIGGEVDDGVLWFWIGTHAAYDEMLG